MELRSDDSSMLVDLWSIQSIEAYDSMQYSNGFPFRCQQRHVDPDMREVYGFMVESMVARGIKRPEDGIAPVWAWYRYGPSVRPDLRRSGFVAKGTKAVMLQLRVERSRVLLSDFELWHVVLNNVNTREHADEGCGSLPDLPLRESWNDVFDLDLARRIIGTTLLEDTCVQACLWEIRKSDVVSVQHFVGR